MAAIRTGTCYAPEEHRKQAAEDRVTNGKTLKKVHPDINNELKLHLELLQRRVSPSHGRYYRMDYGHGMSKRDTNFHPLLRERRAHASRNSVEQSITKLHFLH